MCGCCWLACLSELVGGRLQELEHVGEDAHRERQVDGPGAQVQEAAQQLQGAEAVGLAEQHLQHHRQLLRRLAFVVARELQPHLHQQASARGGMGPVSMSSSGTAS